MARKAHPAISSKNTITPHSFMAGTPTGLGNLTVAAPAALTLTAVPTSVPVAVAVFIIGVSAEKYMELVVAGMIQVSIRALA